MPKKKKNKKLEVIDLVEYKDKKTKELLDLVKEEIKDVKVKGVISIVVPSRGRPLLYTNLTPEEAFLQTYRATSLVAGLISLNEEDEGAEDE